MADQPVPVPVSTDTDRGTARLIIVVVGILTFEAVSALIWHMFTAGPQLDERPTWTAFFVGQLATAGLTCLITLTTTRTRPNDAPEVFKEQLDYVRGSQEGMSAGVLTNVSHDPSGVGAPLEG